MSTTDDRARSDGDERVLEYALKAVHGGLEEVDLSARVADAWRRGERGSGLALLEGAEPSAPPRAARPRRLRPLLLAAAAAALALGGALAWRLADRPAVEPPAAPWFARAPQPVQVLDGPAALPVTQVAAGQAVLLRTGETLELDGGARVRAAGEALLRLEPGTIALELGSLEIEAPPMGALELAGDAGRLALAGGARVLARADLDAPSDALGAGDGAERGRRLLAARGAIPRWWTIELQHGTAQLAAPAGTRSIEAGERWLVARGGALAGPLDDERRNQATKLVDGLVRVKAWEPARGLMPPGSYGGTGELVAMLAEFLRANEHYAPALRWNLRRAFDSPEVNELGRARLLDFLVADPSAEALELARELWLGRPESFLPHHVVALAQRGAFEFEREVRAIAELRLEEPFAEQVPAAALLALEGAEEGLGVLRAWVEPLRLTQDELLATLLAARTLARGGERAAWEELQRTMLELVEEQLDGGAPEAARWLALALEFFHPDRGPLDEERLGLYGLQLEQHVAQGLPRLETDDDVLDLLDEIESGR